MMYDGVINKPPLDELYHFNKNHDPNNGQFTSGSGGSFIKNVAKGSNIDKHDQKKNYNELKRIKKNIKTENGREEFYEATKKIVKDSGLLESEDIKNQLKEADSLKKQFVNLETKYPDFYNSKYREEADKKAYEEAYKWFEKNDPEHLKEAIKYNNGSKKNLDYVDHDFRKTLDWTYDTEWQKAHDEWKKSPEGKNHQRAEDAWDNYDSKLHDIADQITKNIIGKYEQVDDSRFLESSADRTGYYTNAFVYKMLLDRSKKK